MKVIMNIGERETVKYLVLVTNVWQWKNTRESASRNYFLSQSCAKEEYPPLFSPFASSAFSVTHTCALRYKGVPRAERQRISFLPVRVYKML